MAAVSARVTRGLEKLRAYFAKRGHLLSVGAMVAAIAETQTAEVPAGLVLRTLAICTGHAAAPAATLAAVKGMEAAVFRLQVKRVAAVVFCTALAAGGVTISLKAAESARETTGGKAASVAPEAPRAGATAVASRPQPGPVAGLPGAPKASDAAPPLGHPDFYPSPERPLGWRGDGTGAWPGANCVATWNAETGENIVWKTNTLGAGLCQPIVVGEKVFVTADPNLLLCYNVHDGKLLWQTAIDHTLKMPPEDREKARTEQIYFDDLWKQYQRWHKGYDALIAALLAKSTPAKPASDPPDRKSSAVQKQSEVALRGKWEVHDKQDKRLPKPDEPQGVAFLATIGADKQLAEQYRALLAEQEESSWVKHTGTPSSMNTVMHTATPKTAWYSRYLVAQEKYDLWFTANNNWIAWTTYSFPTPITDGKYIYATTANNAVAAVDLNGTIAWLVWEQLAAKAPRNLGTAYTASPLLYKGKLIVYNRCHMRVYDASNGKKLWEVIDPAATAKEAARKQTYNWRSPEGRSPNATTLALPAGGEMDVLLEGWETIWRLDDGRLLCKDLPFRGAATSITKGDVLLFGTPGGVPKGIPWGGAIRLKAVSRDRVETEVLWSSPDTMIHHCTPVFFDGHFIAQISGVAVRHDPQTGEKQPLLAGKTLGTGGHSSPIVAGQRIYCFLGPTTISNIMFGCRVGDCEAKTVTTVGTAILDDRYLRDDEFGLINYGIPCGYQQNSSPSAQANRIFFRSRGMLWCIGDPKQAFLVPKNCPAEARVSAGDPVKP